VQTTGRFRFRAARIGIAAAMLIILGGCASQIPLPDAQSTRNKLGAVLEVAPDEIRSFSRCLIGKAQGTAAAPRAEGVYVVTPQSAAVLDYDPKTKRFSRAFKFDPSTTRGVAMQEQPSIFGPNRQMQVRTENALLVMEFVTADHGTLGMTGKLMEAYEHLQSIGVPVMEPAPYVDRPVTPGTIYIPIYVPR
jgi:hypothetical protein